MTIADLPKAVTNAAVNSSERKKHLRSRKIRNKRRKMLIVSQQKPIAKKQNKVLSNLTIRRPNKNVHVAGAVAAVVAVVVAIPKTRQKARTSNNSPLRSKHLTIKPQRLISHRMSLRNESQQMSSLRASGRNEQENLDRKNRSLTVRRKRARMKNVPMLQRALKTPLLTRFR